MFYHLPYSLLINPQVKKVFTTSTEGYFQGWVNLSLSNPKLSFENTQNCISKLNSGLISQEYGSKKMLNDHLQSH